MDPDRDVERARPEEGRLIAAGSVREDTMGIFGVALGKYFDAPVNDLLGTIWFTTNRVPPRLLQNRPISNARAASQNILVLAPVWPKAITATASSSGETMNLTPHDPL